MYFSPAAQLAIQKKTIIPAYHEIRPEIMVHCMLKVLSQSETSETFKATVGVRQLDDTTLTIGSRLAIKTSDVGEDGGKRVYVCRVEDVEVRQGKTVHVIRVLERQDRTYQRQHKRYDGELSVRRSDNIHFQMANLSQGGMQVYCRNTLTSALIDQPTQMYLVLDNQEVSFECRPCYIVYSWWEQCHKVGLAFLNLAPQQQTALKAVLMQMGASESEWGEAPVSKEEGDEDGQPRKTRIDPETGRILVDK